MSAVPTIKLYGFEFFGPLDLSGDVVSEISDGHLGVYSLGSLSRGSYVPGYFGRSDTCVRTRLTSHVSAAKFSVFCVRRCSSLWEAYSQECKLVHAFADAYRLANINHPARPAGQDWSCPVCGQ